MFELDSTTDTVSLTTSAFVISGYTTTSSSSTYTKCGFGTQGGVFNMMGGDFNDSNSVFTYNSAYKGGVIACSGCEMNLYGSEFTFNLAYRGGVI
jgi:predicted outer membrane repeat protein